MTTLWTQRYAQRTQRMQSSAVRELLKLTEHPEMISFAGGLPAYAITSLDAHSLCNFSEFFMVSCGKAVVQVDHCVG
jgi:hypothetical protein